MKIKLCKLLLSMAGILALLAVSSSPAFASGFTLDSTNLSGVTDKVNSGMAIALVCVRFFLVVVMLVEGIRFWKNRKFADLGFVVGAVVVAAFSAKLVEALWTWGNS